MSVNKSQSQTFEVVGLYLKQPVFSHGQLYVALSRSGDPDHVHVMVIPSEQQGEVRNYAGVTTLNHVYVSVLLATEPWPSLLCASYVCHCRRTPAGRS